MWLAPKPTKAYGFYVGDDKNFIVKHPVYATLDVDDGDLRPALVRGTLYERAKRIWPGTFTEYIYGGRRHEGSALLFAHNATNESIANVPPPDVMARLKKELELPEDMEAKWWPFRP